MADGERIAELESENERLGGENAVLRSENAELAGVVGELRKRVADLEARLGRNSTNSSRPPSSDANATREQQKLNRAQRRAAGRRQGKQPGTDGRHLSQVSNPDHRVTHRPSHCAGCGAGLEGAEVVSDQRRQVFDLPPVKVVVTEHVAQRVRCACCGKVTTGVFPAEATAPACWGPGVQALGLYLTQRQHIPLKRAAELLGDVLGAAVSTGFLVCLAERAARLLAPFTTRAKELLAKNPVIHADETSIRVSAQSWWLHVMASATVTLLVCHRRRGREAIEDIDVLPGYRGVIVHDGLAAYDYLDADHAQCSAHLVRHLNGCAEHPDTARFAQLMTAVLLDAADTAKRCRQAGWSRVPHNTARRLRGRYRYALDTAFASLPPGPPPRRRNTGGWEPHQREAWNLATRLKTGQDDVLRFLTDTRIPPTNNDAERPLRPAKLHDKISGGFRHAEHAKAFATIRSYLGTADKHRKNLYQALVELFTTGPWLPPEATPA